MSSITPSSSSSSSSSWDELPPDLLKVIIDDRLDITSSVRLSTVCTSWVSTIHPQLPSLPPFHLDKLIPWLLLSAHQNSETDCSNTRTPIRTDFEFYDVSTATSYSVPVNIPSLRDHRWLGSYKGWLVTAGPAGRLQLIKPLTGARVSLPPLKSAFRVIKKVIICGNIDELPVTVCLTEGWLLVAKVGDKRWTYLITRNCFQDIIFYQGKVYATSWHGICCYEPQIPTSYKWVMNSKYPLPLYWNSYLLEWKGELIALLMEGNNKIGLQYSSLREVKLYKVNLKDVACPLIEVTSLGSNALFFSSICSYVLPASASASASGRDDIRENCIYLTDQVSSCPCHDAHGFHPNHNFKVYNLGDRTVTPLCPHGSLTYTTQPIFFSPC